jgi:hypothetical protein
MDWILWGQDRENWQAKLNTVMMLDSSGEFIAAYEGLCFTEFVI